MANLVALALAEYEAYEAKRQTQVAREQLRAVIDASPEALLVADDHSGRILDANRQAEALTGRSREELLGLHHGMLYISGQQQATSATATANRLAAEVQRSDGQRVAVQVTTERTELSDGGRLALNILRAA